MIDITFNGIKASDYGLYCKYTNRQMLSEMKPKQFALANKDGFYDYGDNNFKERIITIDFTFKISNYDDVPEKLRDIGNWIYTTEQKQLIISDEYDKYYLARVYQPLDFSEEDNLGLFTITFICQPWAFDINTTGSDSNYQWTGITGTQDLVFTNNGTKTTSLYSTQGSQSDIIITGSFTNLTLTMNGETLTYGASISSETLTIDNINLEIDKDGSNVLTNLSGDLDTFLPIYSGLNTLSVSGTSLNIDITIDFRPEYK